MNPFSIPLVAATLIAACAVHSWRAQALECPLPQYVNGSGAALMSEAEMNALGRRIISDPSGNAVTEAAAELRRKYPKLSTEKTVDVLAGAYCSGIVSQGLEDPVAKEKIRRFAAQVLNRIRR